MRFDKYEGLANDFVVVDARDEAAIDREAAARICDRRRGVGGDGVLLVLPARDPAHVARMKVLNADGSIPEMCGNGLRCVALHVARAKKSDAAASGVYETDAGLRGCVVAANDVEVDMGVVRWLEDRSLEIDGARIEVAVADAGNPHAILFGSFDDATIGRVGPRVATHSAFPRGTNVEFARVSEDGARVDLVVWERGVGLTQACGTGACATVAVACRRGLARWGAPVSVHLPGGALRISVDEATSRATMRGPARHVFSGSLDS